jgi:hypothetical protein
MRNQIVIVLLVFTFVGVAHSQNQRVQSSVQAGQAPSSRAGSNLVTNALFEDENIVKGTIHPMNPFELAIGLRFLIPIWVSLSAFL